MSEHRASIRWSRSNTPFEYDTYSRNHSWSISGQQLKASAAPEFRGEENHVDPEAALVAALSSCHMLTFLAICARKGIVVDDYQDDAIGYLEKNEIGKLAVTRVQLRPQISFSHEAPSPEELQKLHQQAHRGCFIASSVKTKIEIASRN